MAFFYRVYSREYCEERQIFKSTILTDEIENHLDSKGDYQTCHQYICYGIPEFTDFLKVHVAPTVGEITKRISAVLI